MTCSWKTFINFLICHFNHSTLMTLQLRVKFTNFSVNHTMQTFFRVDRNIRGLFDRFFTFGGKSLCYHCYGYPKYRQYEVQAAIAPIIFKISATTVYCTPRRQIQKISHFNHLSPQSYKYLIFYIIKWLSYHFYPDPSR